MDIEYSEMCDYNYLKKSIADVLNRYFEYNDKGKSNPEYDPIFSAQDALDEIKEIISG